MNKPTNDYEALVLALNLGITADTDEQFNRALQMAESFAAKLTDIEVCLLYTSPSPRDQA